MINDKQSIIKLAILVLFISIGTYIFIHFDYYVYFVNKDKAVALIKSYSPFDVFVFTGLQILQVLFAPIPGEATGLLGGFIYGPVLGTIYSTIGLTIGSWLAFMLSRTFGLPFVEKTINPEMVKKYDYLLEHKGAVISFVLFLIPGFPKDALCYIMGLSHMPVGMFLLISTVGRLFGTIMLSVCGSFARNHQKEALLIAFGVTGVIVVIAYLYKDKWLAALRKRHIGRHH